MPSLQELAAFEAAARHGSFSRAAEELVLTQSAISKQVRQLEDSLGVMLFERQNRRVILTGAGEAFRTSAQDLLERVATATHAVMASAGSDGMLTIAVLPTFAARWLIPRLPKFQEDNAGIALTLRTRLEPFDFQDTGIDLAIHYGSPAWPGAEAFHLFEEVVVPVASPAYQHRLRLEQPEDLDRADLLQLATRPRLWSDWFETAGVVFAQPLRGPLFDQFSFTAAAATAGMGVALVPRFLIEEELATRKLLTLFNHNMPGHGAYYAVAPLSKRNHPIVSRFLHWLRNEAEQTRSSDVQAA
jgi:LysR family glycine cleavage system transcriptional activator